MSEKKINDWYELQLTEDLEVTTYWSGKDKPSIGTQKFTLRAPGVRSDFSLHQPAVLTPQKLREWADELEKQEALIVLKGGTQY